MGDRYFLTVICPNCRFKDDDCYYAPTCGFTSWQCPECKVDVDLEKYSGISHEDCSNRELISGIISKIR